MADPGVRLFRIMRFDGKTVHWTVFSFHAKTTQPRSPPQWMATGRWAIIQNHPAPLASTVDGDGSLGHYTKHEPIDMPWYPLPTTSDDGWRRDAE